MYLGLADIISEISPLDVKYHKKKKILQNFGCPCYLFVTSEMKDLICSRHTCNDITKVWNCGTLVLEKYDHYVGF